MATAVVDGRPVAVTGGGDMAVRVWDLAAGEQVGKPLTGHPGSVNAVATVTLDGRPVAVTGSYALECCGINDGDCCGGEVIDEDDFCYICTNCSDPNYGTVLVWDLTTGERIDKPLTAHHDDVLAVATAVVDGRPVAVTGSAEGAVLVWDLAAGEPVGEPLTGHTGAAGAVATGVVDGRPVAVTGGGDGVVRVWDLTARQQMGAPLVFPEPVSALAVARDGRLAVAFGREIAVLTAAHRQEPRDS
ncbi:hypothetical protein GXW82_21890 [Streptacidiphilus sp. 4-A2]|nr:hypothetical protein [Streptacidiphilus sp. 4-A2]